MIFPGHEARRTAVDYGVPLITDVKCAKLLVEALHHLNKEKPEADMNIDSISAGQVIRLPGLIDTHVHLRDPGQTHKEDFQSGTAAALAGGFTMIAAMPNTKPPITDEKTLKLAEEIAKAKAHCDYALYLGATPDNADNVAKLAPQAAALKLYANETFTCLTMTDSKHWKSHIQSWPTSDQVRIQ